MSEKLTIQDIARLAGVSKATVSRVLNQKSNVDATTRERVLRIMNEQSFVPNSAAAGLAGGRSRILGVIVPSLRWPFIPEILRGVFDYLEERSYEILLYSVNKEKDHNDVIDRILATKLATGLLTIIPGRSARHLEELYANGLPVIVFDDQMNLPACPWIGVDNYQAAQMAVKHLLKLGHTRIAHIQGQAHYMCSIDRYHGYRDALLEAGVTPDPTLLVQANYDFSSSGKTSADVLFELPEPPTAIFAGSDQIAYGVLTSAEQHGIRIPDDVALVGFDDMPLSHYLRPAITSVRQPFYEMGQEAAKILLEQIDARHPSIDGAQTVVLEPQTLALANEGEKPIRRYLETSLVVRESCGSL